jgi:hypothetical protein
MVKLGNYFNMKTPKPNEKAPRIASYKVPAGTWFIGSLMLGVAVGLRWMGDSSLRQIFEFVLFAMFWVNALNFFIPLVKPNSILGGAKFKTLVLASCALLGLVSIH